MKDKLEFKGKNNSQNSSKGNSSNNKAKEKGVYKGKIRITFKDLERYRKENKCFKCGDQGYSYRTYPQRNARNEHPRSSMVEASKEDVHCKGSPLSYAWGKVRKHDAFILFDPGSTHNFVSIELATKLGIEEFVDMGDAMKANGAFIGQDVLITPLIGKLRLHIQGYVDKEDFFISPLKHEDVILGALWIDCMAASIKLLERKIVFKFKERDMYIDAQESGDTIPLVNDQAFDKSTKSSIFAYMIFVKDSLNDAIESKLMPLGDSVADTIAVVCAEVLATEKGLVDEEEFKATQAKFEAARMPAPLHNPPFDDTKLKGALHASINLYGKGNLEEDDMEQENVLAIDEFAARTGGKLKALGPQSSLAHYLGQLPPGNVVIVYNEFTPQGHFMTGGSSSAIPILPPPSLPDPPASLVITPSTSHPVPLIQPPDVSPDHALSDSDSDLDVADATPKVDLAPPRRKKRIPGWLYSTVASSGVT
ncbi:hypothetical protein L7F22_050443 [Adiantum nelumboides]|nr:hypothetical protein [Adiantum nelumboides]